MRGWRRTPSGRAAIKKYRRYPSAIAAQKKYYHGWYTLHGRKRALDYVARIKTWQKDHPAVMKAHYAVKNAIDTKKLVRPSVCSNCQETKRVVAHHDDNTKPFEIRWLCHSCDKIEHNKAK